MLWGFLWMWTIFSPLCLCTSSHPLKTSYLPSLLHSFPNFSPRVHTLPCQVFILASVQLQQVFILLQGGPSRVRRKGSQWEGSVWNPESTGSFCLSTSHLLSFSTSSTTTHWQLPLLPLLFWFSLSLHVKTYCFLCFLLNHSRISFSKSSLECPMLGEAFLWLCSHEASYRLLCVCNPLIVWFQVFPPTHPQNYKRLKESTISNLFLYPWDLTHRRSWNQHN